MTETNKKTEETFNKNVERLNKQVEETMKKAFFDLLEQKVASNPPDYNWLTRLYTEIRDKLTKLLKPTSKLRKHILEQMDPEFFHQLISNNVFEPKSFYALICFVFEQCKALGSPGRDKETDEKLKEILDHFDSGNATFATLVPMFIKNANYCIDNIYLDIQNLQKQISN
tara:strand:+ start:9568 stop:10077 length:510 start_codon:yes stop_codon:yes gene_type:complete